MSENVKMRAAEELKALGKQLRSILTVGDMLERWGSLEEMTKTGQSDFDTKQGELIRVTTALDKKQAEYQAFEAEGGAR